MNPDEIKKHLRAEEERLHGNASAMCDENTDNEYDVMVVEALEALAACRALLKKHEWVWANDTKTVKYCPECGRRYVLSFIDEYPQETWEHQPDCAIATALKGVGGE